MKKCNSYHITAKKYYTYNTITGAPIAHERKVGECWGTQECDECNCGGDRRKCDFYEDVKKEALEPKFGEWISVKDRLPERRTYVLCYFKYEPESPNVVVENYYHGGGHWLSEGSHVTHWMPLPEPPKESE